jgi:2-C-methyl-D-erythritol 4-phosphate cytidylyltransferase
VAIIAAAGEGSRFSSDISKENPKQCRMLLDCPLYMWSLREFISSAYITSIVLIGNEYILNSMQEQVEAIDTEKRIDVICGGNTRQDSVYLGLKQSESHTPKPTHALIHDAARPLITENDINAVALEVIASGAATMASVVPDTVKKVDRDTLYIKETLNRDELYLAQTPQGGRLDWLLEAHKKLVLKGQEVTDDAACLEHAGHSVKVVPGSRFNIKVTHSEDMDICRYILSNRSL